MAKIEQDSVMSLSEAENVVVRIWALSLDICGFHGSQDSCYEAVQVGTWEHFGEHTVTTLWV